MKDGHNGTEALDSLYWRGEILQALYWMRGEGLAEEIEPTVLAEFLAADAATVSDQLERLVLDDYLEPLPGTAVGYRLTDVGAAEGARSFRDEFAELTRPTHGECSSDCICHDPAHAGETCPSHPEGPHGS